MEVRELQGMGHVSHRSHRALTRAMARIALVLAALTFAGAVIHFSYIAYESSQCYTEVSDDPLSHESRDREPVDSDECRLILASSEERQRIDAAIAVLAIVVGSGAAVRLSSASRHTQRVILLAEVIVVAVGVVYTVLLASALR